MHSQTQAQQPQQAAVRAILVNYYCIAPRTARTREERLQWAAEQFARTHPTYSRAKAYMILEQVPIPRSKEEATRA